MGLFKEILRLMQLFGFRLKAGLIFLGWIAEGCLMRVVTMMAQSPANLAQC
jgi:hypothetical protein